MTKKDFKKELKEVYNTSSKKISIIQVPKINYIMIDGTDDPNKKEYQESISTLYKVAFTIKFMIKKQNIDNDYVVMPLECLWWADDVSAFKEKRTKEWFWTLMIMQPDIITKDIIKEAINIVKEKNDLFNLEKMYIKSIQEKTSIQLMHIGPYDEEEITINKLHDFCKNNGYIINGKHHEIYISDPRKTKKEKLKTIIRYPVKIIQK